MYVEANEGFIDEAITTTWRQISRACQEQAIATADKLRESLQNDSSNNLVIDGQRKTDLFSKMRVSFLPRPVVRYDRQLNARAQF